ncbi:MAG TPA: hypothetical protein VF661_09855 [Actinomycetales bacterium]|jgi:6-phosphofructokinase
MTQQTGPVGPRQDEALAQETRGLVQGGRSTRAEEWRDPEPAGEDQPTGDVGILPEDRRGTPKGMTSQDVELRSQIARFLDRGALPGDRDSVVASAIGHNAPTALVERLQELPAGEHLENVQAVARALGLGTEVERS